MPGIEVRIEGYEKARAHLDKYEARALRNRLNRAMAAGGRLVRDAQRAAAPVRSGATRKSIAVKSLRSGGVNVGPRGKSRADWGKISAVIYGRKKGNHGVTPAHGYVLAGARAVRGEVLRIIRDAAIK